MLERPRRPPEHRRPVRQQRGRAAGRDARPGPALGRGSRSSPRRCRPSPPTPAPMRSYVPSAPFGGDLPFRPDRGVANYYGVGGYRRPLSDARTAGVRFAAECLAFANVPDDGIATPSTPADRPSPAWKAGVPRDAGAGWDFDDVRDHYLALLFGVDPVDAPARRPDRYLELSRAVSGEVMADGLRRVAPCRHRPAAAGSSCGCATSSPAPAGACVDRDGAPKTAYHHLRRALAPTAVWTDRRGPRRRRRPRRQRPARAARCARLRIALYRDLRASRRRWRRRPIELPAHGVDERNVEDAHRALRRRLVGLSLRAAGPGPRSWRRLETIDGDAARPLSQAFRFPVGPPAARRAGELGSACGRCRRRRRDRRHDRSRSAGASPTASGSTRPRFPADDDAFDRARPRPRGSSSGRRARRRRSAAAG